MKEWARAAKCNSPRSPNLRCFLIVVARQTGSISLSGMFEKISVDVWQMAGLSLALVVAALLVVLLCENARIPVDDPNTHLELTMIHEVMVLDHGGPDLAFIVYGAALKLWVLGALLIGIAAPIHSGNAWIDIAVSIGGMLALGAVVGIIESTMARLRLVRVPQLLVGAGVLATLALILVLR